MAERTPANPADYSGADYIRFVCGTCQDFRVVAAPDGIPGSILCPNCGTDERRRELFIKSKSMPEIRISDLDDEESDLFRQWRFRGHHELDCLRWIEGRRYKPEEDPEFLADVNIRLDAWRKARDTEYDNYRRNHPYSKGDGRIGRERDSEGRLFQEKDSPGLPPLHPCIKCGTACDEQTLFCPPCWATVQEKRKGMHP